MNLDELRSVQSKERRKDSLQHLRDAFYDDVAAYVADLRAARDRRAEQVANPFSDDDVRRMSDEIETAEEVAEALYERRVGKVVKLASFAAADMPVETEGMTTQERALFDDLVDRIETNKSAVLDVLAGEEPPDEAPSAMSSEQEPRSDPESMVADRPDPTANGDSGADTSTEPTDTTAESNVLAGAMGGESGGGRAVDDTDDSTAPEVSADDAAGGSPHDDDPAAPASADEDPDPTPVDPEPAPPGAPHVAESPKDSDPTANPVADGSGSAADSGSGTNDEEPIDRNAESTAGEGADRETVRITRDVGAIFGVDEREYDLASEDVVALPAENAEPLVQRDAAERID